jgi:hypothetical protein
VTVLAVNLHRAGVKLVRKCYWLSRLITNAVTLCAGDEIGCTERNDRDEEHKGELHTQCVVKHRFFHARTRGTLIGETGGAPEWPLSLKTSATMLMKAFQAEKHNRY